MPARIYVVNRYCSDDPVVGAAITFDNNPVTAQSPRTGATGWVTVATENLADGNHVLKVTPAYTSGLPAGPDIAENLPNSVTRMFRSLEVNVAVRRGRVEAVVLAAGQNEQGVVGAGLNPIVVQLQPIFFKGLGEYQTTRKPDAISLIVLHQTSQSTNVHGSLATFKSLNNQGQPKGSPHYLVSAEARPQVVKISRDNHPAGHAGGNLTSWGGRQNADVFSIGIENSHRTGTPWPQAQMERLIRLLEQLVRAYPSIPRHRIVGHTDVLSFDRECPGMDFDWALLEREGLGMVPRAGALSLDRAYGGFFRLHPESQLQPGDDDGKRLWGRTRRSDALASDLQLLAGHDRGSPGRQIEAQAAIATVIRGKPIYELQTDLRDIGYNVTPTGAFDELTRHAVAMFQKHFFSGSRRAMVAEDPRTGARGKVDRVTAEYIKRVRP